jgi:hypothetical protein
LGQTSILLIFFKEKLGFYASSPVPVNVLMPFKLPSVVVGGVS